jgi:hypothetical protein
LGGSGGGLGGGGKKQAEHVNLHMVVKISFVSELKQCPADFKRSHRVCVSTSVQGKGGDPGGGDGGGGRGGAGGEVGGGWMTHWPQ